MGTQLGVGIEDPVGGVMGGTREFETLIGRTVDATRHYRGFDDPINGEAVTASIAGGRSPLIAWHAFNKLNNGTDARWKFIAAGLYDAVILQRADELRSLGNVPIRFVFHHEPENDIDSIGDQGKCGASPAEFAPAWVHVKRTMRSAGVGTNVKFGVCLMGTTYRKGLAPLWIPSTMKPDFIASDGYNHGTATSAGWRSFTDIFSSALSFAASRGKLLTIEECGTVEGQTDQKAAWFAAASAAIKSWAVPMFMYSQVTADKPFGMMDYHVDTSASALTSFKGLVGAL